MKKQEQQNNFIQTSRIQTDLSKLNRLSNPSKYKRHEFMPAFNDTHIHICKTDYNIFLTHFSCKNQLNGQVATQLNQLIIQNNSTQIHMLSNHQVIIFTSVLKYNGDVLDYLYLWDLNNNTRVQSRYFGEDCSEDYTDSIQYRIDIKCFVFQATRRICICETKFEVQRCHSRLISPCSIKFTYYQLQQLPQKPSEKQANIKDTKLKICHYQYLKLDKKVKIATINDYFVHKMDDFGSISIYAKQIQIKTNKITNIEQKGNLQQKIKMQNPSSFETKQQQQTQDLFFSIYNYQQNLNRLKNNQGTNQNKINKNLHYIHLQKSQILELYFLNTLQSQYSGINNKVSQKNKDLFDKYTLSINKIFLIYPESQTYHIKILLTSTQTVNQKNQVKQDNLKDLLGNLNLQRKYIQIIYSNKQKSYRKPSYLQSSQFDLKKLQKGQKQLQNHHEYKYEVVNKFCNDRYSYQNSLKIGNPRTTRLVYCLRGKEYLVHSLNVQRCANNKNITYHQYFDMNNQIFTYTLDQKHLLIQSKKINPQLILFSIFKIGLIYIDLLDLVYPNWDEWLLQQVHGLFMDQELNQKQIF